MLCFVFSTSPLVLGDHLPFLFDVVGVPILVMASPGVFWAVPSGHLAASGLAIRQLGLLVKFGTQIDSFLSLATTWHVWKKFPQFHNCLTLISSLLLTLK